MKQQIRTHLLPLKLSIELEGSPRRGCRNDGFGPFRSLQCSKHLYGRHHITLKLSQIIQIGVRIYHEKFIGYHLEIAEIFKRSCLANMYEFV